MSTVGVKASLTNPSWTKFLPELCTFASDQGSPEFVRGGCRIVARRKRTAAAVPKNEAMHTRPRREWKKEATVILGMFRFGGEG